MPDDEPENLKKAIAENAPPVTKTSAEATDAQGMPSVLPDDEPPLKKSENS